MDRDTFEEMLWLGCGIELTRLMWINQPCKPYLMSLGMAFEYDDREFKMIMDFSESCCPLEKALQLIADELYLKVKQGWFRED